MQFLPPRDNGSLREFDMREAQQSTANAIGAADKTSYREAQPVHTNEPWQRAVVGIFLCGPTFSALFYGLAWWCWRALT